MNVKEAQSLVTSDEQAITVYSKDGNVFDWCNHAGAEIDEVLVDPGLETEFTEKALVCDKCNLICNFEGEWL